MNAADVERLFPVGTRLGFPYWVDAAAPGAAHEGVVAALDGKRVLVTVTTAPKGSWCDAEGRWYTAQMGELFPRLVDDSMPRILNMASIAFRASDWWIAYATVLPQPEPPEDPVTS